MWYGFVCGIGMIWFVVLVWYGMVWYGMVWYSIVWYGMVWYGMVWYDMVWYGMVWYDMVWYGMVWYHCPVAMSIRYFGLHHTPRVRQATWLTSD